MKSVVKNIVVNKVNNIVVESDDNELLTVTDLINMSREDIMSYRHKLCMAASNSIFDINKMDTLLTNVDMVDEFIANNCN